MGVVPEVGVVPEAGVIPEVREVSEMKVVSKMEEVIKMEVVLEVGKAFRTQAAQEKKEESNSTHQLTMPHAAGKKEAVNV